MDTKKKVTKEELAEILTTNNVKGRVFYDSSIDDNVLDAFNNKLAVFADKHPNFDLFDTDYTGEETDTFIDMVNELSTLDKDLTLFESIKINKTLDNLFESKSQKNDLNSVMNRTIGGIFSPKLKKMVESKFKKSFGKLFESGSISNKLSKGEMLTEEDIEKVVEAVDECEFVEAVDDVIYEPMVESKDLVSKVEDSIKAIRHWKGDAYQTGDDVDLALTDIEDSALSKDQTKFNKAIEAIEYWKGDAYQTGDDVDNALKIMKTLKLTESFNRELALKEVSQKRFGKLYESRFAEAYQDERKELTEMSDEDLEKELNESKLLESALSDYNTIKKKAKEESKGGFVQHVNVSARNGEISFGIDDFYDSGETIASYESGETLLEETFDDEEAIKEWIEEHS